MNSVQNQKISDARARYANRNIWSGVLFGLGLAAFVDETVFHQLLHWHHFYDQSTKAIGLVSDGFFHAFSWFSTIASLFLLADLRRRDGFWLKRWWSGMMLGGGGFQLYDGIIQHKLMRIHQIRYVDNLFTYDLVWNIIAAIMILLGIILLRTTQKELRGLKGTIQHAT